MPNEQGVNTLQKENAINTFVEGTGGWIAASLEACTRCGLCAEACHFYIPTGNPEYTPIWKVELLRRAYEQRFTLSGKVKRLLGIEKEITNEDLAQGSIIAYEACTMCNKCSMVCPMGIQIGPLIHGVRAGLASAGVVPADLQAALQTQIETGSPLGVTQDRWEDRLEWVADDWEVEIPIDKEGADTLVVFTSLEVMKFPGNIAAIAEIMTQAGENWTVSSKGREVVNFGFFEGNEERTALLARRLYDAAVELGVKRIMVTECGHAYDLLRWTAANFMKVPDGIEATHVVGMIGDFVRTGRIKLKPGFHNNGVITFHDACKIQRRGGHLNEPRELLKILAPDSFREMMPNREEAICCGGGGGVIAIKEAAPLRFAAFELKKEQLEKVGADTVVMSCANCRLQFTDGVQHFDMPVKVAGFSEMVADAMEMEEEE